MARDHKKLRVFQLANTLVKKVYAETVELPPEERYGLQSQLRRAAVSAAVNIVEGCSRRTTKDYTRFLEISLGSAQETKYLLEIAEELALLRQSSSTIESYDKLVRSLQKLIDRLGDDIKSGSR